MHTINDLRMIWKPSDEQCFRARWLCRCSPPLDWETLEITTQNPLKGGRHGPTVSASCVALAWPERRERSLLAPVETKETAVIKVYLVSDIHCYKRDAGGSPAMELPPAF